MKQTKKILFFILCAVVVAAMTLTLWGCKNNVGDTADSISDTADESQELNEDGEIVVGDGEKSFAFSVIDEKGKETKYRVYTDKNIVGEALEELSMISGTDGPYGLYVDTVCGKMFRYETDGKYWAFYINDGYANSGIEKTEIDQSAKYTLKVS